MSQQADFNQLLNALKERKFFALFNENPKAYSDELNAAGLQSFQKKLNSDYFLPDNKDLKLPSLGDEISPYLQTGLGIQYFSDTPENLIQRSKKAAKDWRNIPVQKRYDILFSSLYKVSERFFELAYATMHTTGQSFLMSFQASGPHACDRALEVLTTGLDQLTYYPQNVEWTKNMGKFDLTIHKTFKPIPKGVGLIIGCSTFPTWNSVPGLYADLICGNTAIVKPHPKAVYPIAIFVEELQNALIENGLSPDIVLLAPDTAAEPITKTLAEHPEVSLIDYTGGNHFGDYVESLGKTCFTEKAGINSVLIDSCKNPDAVAQNIAFSISFYSGQMCTAPQNIFIPSNGVNTPEGQISFDEMYDKIKNALKGLMENPKAAAPTLGAIQNDQTLNRVNETIQKYGDSAFKPDVEVVNQEFNTARIAVPTLITVDAADTDKYLHECFGPVAFIVKTTDFNQSLHIIKDSAKKNGAITCLAFCIDEPKKMMIEDELNSVFTPVSFNFAGAAFVNQHAAFSDLHVSGGNPAGNATFTNNDFINKRYIWIGNRYML